MPNAFAVLRLLPMSDQDKDAEILALRHQIAVLERQLGRHDRQGTSEMQSSHAAAAVSSAFGDPNLIAYGELEPVVRLAERCGLPGPRSEDFTQLFSTVHAPPAH
ncbi:hypothetical protein Z951_15210 [Streptomyces sp. PRh5]|uniref:hypothetical protein n=1 Tax=Streptomyces sp. PRh5 TaxID=1158056 RepID=UPI0004496434|nr:hypothetical protein [Streptomyces sp. PRh5]EXU67232.1 hypothetical protein Z951_15210 [Streptomyces sp. PRh5]